MFFKLAFVITSLTIFILSIGGYCCSTGLLEAGVAECCFNYYNDGYECRACPPGYYGKNCSEVCSAPYFGLGCNQKCECYPCHHIHGCRVHNNATECPSGCSEVCTSSYYGSTCKGKCNCTPCHHKYGCNHTLIMEETTILESVANPDKNTQTPKQERKNTGRIIIIVAGSALSLALILKIIYELYTYFHISKGQIVVPHVVNDVYEDIVAGHNFDSTMITTGAYDSMLALL